MSGALIGGVQALAAMAVAAVAATGLTLGLQKLIASRHRGRNALEIIALLDVASDGIVIHHKGMVLEANEPFCRLMRYTREQVIGRSVLQFLAPDTDAPVLRRLTGEEPRSDSMQLGLIAADGQYLAAVATVRLVTHDGHPACVIAFRDMTNSNLVEARAEHLSSHDPLTDLVAPAAFESIVSKALIMATHHDRPLAVMRLDIDRFRRVREEWGDVVGDRLLQMVARRLRDASNPDHTLARLGGDDFAALLPRLDQIDAAVAAATSLLEILNRPYSIDGQSIRLTSSIGVALSPANGDLPSKLLSNAWTALQRAKREGTNRICFFEEKMDREMQRRSALLIDLRIAVAKRKFDLHYQPLLDCRGLSLAGYEALLRWTHPVHGPVSPAEFIPMAEEIGLIAELGSWVLEVACAEAADWDNPAFIAVNLSPAQFQEPDLLGDVARILKKTGLAPHRLELEVTEGMLIDDPQRALQALTGLKSLGIGISLDDFGTGYSSLRYLQRFPFDRIKIDKSFVQNIGTSEKADAIVDVVIGLARSLHMLVTAEGVETQAQYDALCDRDCDIVQGWLFSKALPSHAIRGLRRFDLISGRLLRAGDVGDDLIPVGARQC